MCPILTVLYQSHLSLMESQVSGLRDLGQGQVPKLVTISHGEEIPIRNTRGRTLLLSWGCLPNLATKALNSFSNLAQAHSPGEAVEAHQVSHG